MKCAWVWMLGVALVSGCARSDADALAANVRAIAPSVVFLSMRIPPEHRQDKYDDGFATGFVVASGSWGNDVLTAAHAVDGAWDLRVTVANRERRIAKIVAVDRHLDLALLHVGGHTVSPLPLGSGAPLQPSVGEPVALVGYPVPDEFADEGLGLTWSVNAGLLSAVRTDTLEVTIPIVPGESGAPVFFSRSGEIIGMADSRFDDEPSIGFAVPIADARHFLHRVDKAHGF